MERKQNKVVVILGPTSSGKTSLSLKLCQDLGGSIISADSRQIYKHMDIGTGKIPTTESVIYKKDDNNWQIGGVKVYGYDLVSPNDYFSSYDYAIFALTKIADIKKSSKKIFLVGGTGFYIDMVTGRVKPANIAPNFKLREKLEELELRDLQKKYADLKIDKEIDLNNPARLIRAIEKEKSTQPMQEELKYLDNNDFIFIGLTASREFLYKRADMWAEEVWKNGLLKETETLLKSEFSNSRKLDGIVYKEAKMHIQGVLSSKNALQKMKFSLHAYIRRQQTYFKKMPNINWVDIQQDNKFKKVYNIING